MVIEPSDWGYCECENGKRAMKKGDERLEFYGYAYDTCNDACSTKGASINWSISIMLTLYIYIYIYISIIS